MFRIDQMVGSLKFFWVGFTLKNNIRTHHLIEDLSQKVLSYERRKKMDQERRLCKSHAQSAIKEAVQTIRQYLPLDENKKKMVCVIADQGMAYFGCKQLTAQCACTDCNKNLTLDHYIKDSNDDREIDGIFPTEDQEARQQQEEDQTEHEHKDCCGLSSAPTATTNNEWRGNPSRGLLSVSYLLRL